MLHEIHLERAADTSVLQCNEAVVFCAYNSAFLYQVGVNVYFAYVVDYDGKFNSLAVGQYIVEQRGLAAAEVSGEEEYWYPVHV